MIHPISAKTSTEAWLRAVNLLNRMEDRCAYNVILDIDDPIILSPTDRSIVEVLDRFLVSHDTQAGRDCGWHNLSSSALSEAWCNRRFSGFSKQDLP